MNICPPDGPIINVTGHIHAHLSDLTATPGTTNFPSKLGQIGPKWDKSGTF